ncbi:VanZ family protein [Winogradskyella sp. A2]|uniref:VanZ family protein n=1 Tax=Winogradskyella sp. A2 TaxID=3366944 RepID=UPI00398C33A0
MAISYTIALIVLSLINIPDIPDLGSTFDDKILHFVAYFILAIIWITYVKPLQSKATYNKVLIATVALGTLLEVLQLVLNPNRSFDVLDMLANALGAFIGTLIAIRFTLLKLK